MLNKLKINLTLYIRYFYFLKIMSDYIRRNAYLKPMQKDIVRRRCRDKCNHCEDPLEEGNIEYDHIIPYRVSDNNKIGNYQTLCPPCHTKKTKEDKRLIYELKQSPLKKICRIYQQKNHKKIAIILCDRGEFGEEIRIKLDYYNSYDYDSYDYNCNCVITNELNSNRIYCIRTGNRIS